MIKWNKNHEHLLSHTIPCSSWSGQTIPLPSRSIQTIPCSNWSGHTIPWVWPDDTLLQPFWSVNTYLARDGRTTPKSGTVRQAWLVDDTLIQLVWPDYTLLQQVWLDNNLLQQVWPDWWHTCYCTHHRQGKASWAGWLGGGQGLMMINTTNI